MRLLHPALVSTLFLLSAAPASAERMILSAGGHLVTPVMLNGTGPFDFVIDSCASATMLTAGMPERLGLASAGGAGPLHGASGNGSVSLFRLGRLEVDGRARGPLAVPSLQGQPGGPPPWSGVIGADILSAYVAEFDVPGGNFRLHDPATDLAASGNWRSLAFTLNPARFPVLEGTLDGKPMHVLLDTGARRTLINWAAARQLGLVPGDPGLAAAHPVHGATAQEIATVSHGFGTIAIGGFEIPAGDILIADLPVFGPLGWTGQPAMILGMDRMAAFHFAVDYPRGRLLVAQAAAR